MPTISQVAAIPAATTIKFAANGLDTFSGGTVFTIDGTIQVDYWDLSWRTFQWTAGSTHTIAASTPLTGWDSTVYSFDSWTNGNGLTSAVGIFTVPNEDTTVTANYGPATVEVNFAASGLDTFPGGVVLTVDGLGYNYHDLPSTHFIWEKGSTHTIAASTPLTGWDEAIYTFAGWTNGNGLTGATGTFTVPNEDTTVTVHYEVATVQIDFATSVLDTFTGGVVLTIDGLGYDYYDLPSTHFIWEKGSTHTIAVSTPLTGWDSTVYSFDSWTNGNGLTGTSGTYTTPNFNTTVTANYKNTTTTEPKSTSITINCAPQTVNTNLTNTTTLTGTLTHDSTGIPDKTILLSYSDGGAWTPIATTTTQSDGSYTHNWQVPSTIANGYYVIKAEFTGDETYTASTAITGTTGNGADLLVVPEYTWGGLAALLTCLAALLLFKKRDSLLHH
ncbi:MAG: hypothetical protein NWF04_02530 [Candidatus Bathyarchaeota archaeon]|nr:hypothetical protein [Candidatus Bathyarchaeota archaeon]